MPLDTRDLMQAAAALHEHSMDGLRLFRPTKPQEDALRNMSLEHIFEVLIVAGNRAGKSVLAAVFFASFLRDVPITCWSGEQIHCRPERLRGQTVNAWLIGDHLKHIGQTLYRLLFDPKPSKGLFRIIKDQVTGAWRPWEPEKYPGDRDRKNESRWNPPIIPPSFFDGEPSWAHKVDHEFRVIRLKNGASIYAFASSAEVKQGDPVDLIWNDENIVTKNYYQEWLSRLRDDGGMIMWSTIPRDDCYVFNAVIDRLESYEEEIKRGERTPEELRSLKVHLSYLDSPFIDDVQKELALEQSGDRDSLVRIYGLRSTQLISIYQDFSADFHCVNYADDKMNDKVTRALEKNNWRPPSDWTRELILDPGTQKPAVLLGAIPPIEFWDHGEPYFICYDELYVRRMTPDYIAESIMRKERNYYFERFIIDNRMGRQTPPGYVERVDYQYTKAFRKAKLQSRQTGFGFIAGDDNFVRRSHQVINAMRSRPCGRPQLRIIAPACPRLVEQLKSNIRKTTPDGETKEEAADNQVDDMRVCLEYWISRRPTYVRPPSAQVDDLTNIESLYHQRVAEHKARQPRVAPVATNFIGVPA